MYNNNLKRASEGSKVMAAVGVPRPYAKVWLSLAREACLGFPLGRYIETHNAVSLETVSKNDYTY